MSQVLLAVVPKFGKKELSAGADMPYKKCSQKHPFLAELRMAVLWEHV